MASDTIRISKENAKILENCDMKPKKKGNRGIFGLRQARENEESRKEAKLRRKNAQTEKDLEEARAQLWKVSKIRDVQLNHIQELEAQARERLEQESQQLTNA